MMHPTTKHRRRRRAAPVAPGNAPRSARRSRRLWPLVGLLLLITAAIVYAARGWNAAAEPPVLAVEIVRSYPHDPNAYTQGLVFDQGKLLEGTGRYGQSTVREVELATGRVERQVALEQRFFGEGITLWDDKILQLTWKSKKGFVYDRRTLARQGSFDYQGEGWGLTFDGRHLILSNGTSRLKFIDPKTWKVVKNLVVRVGRNELSKLNELEYVDGSILANVWYEDYIAKISPRTGQVQAWLDLQRLYPAHLRPDRDDVLNGIAYDAVDKRLFVTGKNWPTLFEVRIVQR